MVAVSRGQDRVQRARQRRALSHPAAHQSVRIQHVQRNVKSAFMPLSWNRYGKSCVRVVKVKRAAAQHEVVDLTLVEQLERAVGLVAMEGPVSSIDATVTRESKRDVLARR